MSSHKSSDAKTKVKPDSPSALVPSSLTKPRRIHTSSQHEAWIPSLHLLKADQKILLSESQWLNDNIINAAQVLLQNQAKSGPIMLQGFQNTLLGKRYRFKALQPEGGSFVQIVHINSNHWVTTTNVGCASDSGEVRVYDSLNNYVTLDMQKQICSFLRPPQKTLRLHVMDMQKQSDSSSCGLFAISVATALAHGLNPSKLMWDVAMMRKHLLNCLDAQKLVEFPASDRKICPGSMVVKKVQEQIFCSCRMPIDPRRDMVKCFVTSNQNCLQLYHPECCGVSIDDPAVKNKSWACKVCTS